MVKMSSISIKYSMIQRESQKVFYLTRNLSDSLRNRPDSIVSYSVQSEAELSGIYRQKKKVTDLGDFFCVMKIFQVYSSFL